MDSTAEPRNEDSITFWLNEARNGNSAACVQLWERVYDEVRRLAQQAVHRESAPISVQATEIAHQVYLRLSTGQALAFENRSHLLVTVARAIRRLLVDHARSRHALKRGG